MAILNHAGDYNTMVSNFVCKHRKATEILVQKLRGTRGGIVDLRRREGGRRGEKGRAEIGRDPKMKLERNNKLEKGRRNGRSEREKRAKWIWGMGGKRDKDK